MINFFVLVVSWFLAAPCAPALPAIRLADFCLQGHLCIWLKLELFFSQWNIMFNNCGSCLGAIRADTPSVTCSGVCRKQFHSSCVDVAGPIVEYLRSCSGLSWSCSECKIKCFVVDMEELNRMLKQKYTELINNLNDTFSDLKTNFLKIADTRLSQDLQNVGEKKASYLDILKNKTQPGIIITPKNKEQDVAATKTALSTKINPAETNLSISKVRGMKDGSLLIGCSNKDDNARFKKIAQDKLADDYEIKDVKGILPRVKIVGLTRNFVESELSDLFEYMTKTNSELFNLDSVCKVIKVYPTKKNSKVYQAILEIDRNTYENLIKADFLLIGYDYCKIYDAHEIKRCFKCSEFNHSSKFCRNSRACPKCAKDHNLKDCASTDLCCSNCIKHEKSGNSEIDKNHAVWDTRCPVYKLAMEKLKHDILAIQ